MKFAARLAAKLRTKNINNELRYWQNNYISLLDQLSIPAMEIKDNKIINFNFSAAKIPDLGEIKENISANQIFNGLQEINFGKNPKIFKALISVKSLVVYNAVLTKILSADNYLIELVAPTKNQNINVLEPDQLLQSNKILEASINQSPSAIIITDEKGYIIYSNRRSNDMFESLNISKPTNILFDEQAIVLYDTSGQKIQTADMPIHKALMEGKKTDNLEVELIVNKIKRIWVSANGTPLRDEKDKIIAALLIITDIDAQKKAEIQFHESNRMLQTILDTIPTRVFWKDTNFKYLGCNKRFLDDAGLQSLDQIIGKTDYELVWANQAANYQKDDRLVITTNKIKLNFEEPQTTPEGNTIWLKTSKIPLKDLANKTIGVLGAYDDITRLKETVIELEKHQDKLELLVNERTIEVARINEELGSINNELCNKNDELRASNKKLLDEIEERINIELKLKESEGTFRSFIEQSSDGICLIDQAGNFIEWNNAMSSIFETKRSIYINQPSWDLEYDSIPKDQRTQKRKQQLKNIVTNFLQKGKDQIRNFELEKFINGKTKYIQYRVFPIQTETRRIFGRINVDITEQRASEIELERYKNQLEQLVNNRTSALQQSEAQMRLLLHSMPLAYYSYNLNDRSKTLWYSEQIESLSGFKVSNFSKNPDLWLSRINKSDYNKIKSTFENIGLNSPVSCEYRWKNSKGRDIWIYDQAVLINGPEDKNQIVGCFLDISELKEAERSIIESERNYREIFNSSSDAIFIHNAVSGKIEDVNNTMLKMYQTNFSNVLRKDMEFFTLGRTPYDSRNFKIHIKIALEQGIHSFEWLSRRDDLSLFWSNITLKTIIINGEQKILSVVRDIDASKKVQEQIKYRNEFEKLIFSISSRFIKISFDDVDTNINAALGEICHFTHTSASYLFFYNDFKETVSITHLWQEDPVSFRTDKMQNVGTSLTQWHKDQIKANKIVEVQTLEELPIEAAKIKAIIGQNNVKSFIDVPLVFQGAIIGFFGICTHKPNRAWHEDEVSLIKVIGQTFVNALKRKESMLALLDSEQLHRQIYNATSEAMIVQDLQGDIFLDVNNAMQEMYNYTYNEALSATPSDISATNGNFSLEKWNLLKQKTQTTGPQVFEWKSCKKSGFEFWVEVSMKGAIIKGDKRVLVVIRDITDRNKAQEELKLSEEKYRLLIEGQTDLIIKIKPEGEFLFVSPSYCELYGKPERELCQSNFILNVHEQERQSTLAAIKKLNKAPFTCYAEHRSLTKHGWRWLAWSYKAITDPENNLIEIIGVGRDITYQKGVEEALRLSEDRFRSIVQQLSDIVLIIDELSIVLYDTPSIKNILGYNEGYFVGKSLVDFLYPDDKNHFAEKINSLVSKNQQISTFELRIKNSQDKWLPMETVGINMLGHPSINGIIITLRNISERKQVEKRILDAIIKTEDQERDRFAKNLHDDLGPLLSSIKMYINSFSTAHENEKKEFIVKQLNEVVKEAITTTKEVSNDLSPHILNNYGLISATESFLRKIPSEIEVLFEKDLISERFSNTIENAMYRIIKELVNNTLKHANASKISFSIQEKNQALILEYADNGKGFNLEELENHQMQGMGLSNIFSRAKTLNGAYEFDTSTKNGFIFKMAIPINQTLD